MGRDPRLDKYAIEVRWASARLGAEAVDLLLSSAVLRLGHQAARCRNTDQDDGPSDGEPTTQISRENGLRQVHSPGPGAALGHTTVRKQQERTPKRPSRAPSRATVLPYGFPLLTRSGLLSSDPDGSSRRIIYASTALGDAA